MEVATRLLRSVVVFGLVSLAICLSPVNAQIPAPDPRLYVNVDYQFSVGLPRKLTACVSEHTNHGVDIILERGAHCEEDYGRIPYIDISANYNVATESKTTARLANILCRYGVFRRIVWLSQITLDGRKAAGCRRYLEDGRVSVLIVTLRKTDSPVWEWIEVAAYLETTMSRYDSDMRTFRSVLAGIWIHPDGPLE